MKLHFGLALAPIISIGTLGSAMAADMPLKAVPPPPPPAPIWTGFYVGGTVGGGWARSSQTDTFGITTGNYNQSGALAGGTFGYNWQWANVLVLGAEADISWSNINGSATLPGLCSAGQGNTCFTNMQWLTTERARVGVIVSNNWLLYGTFGVAGAGIKTGQLSCATPVAGAIASCGNPTEWSAVGGVGAEVMFAPHWSAKLEYLYTGFHNRQAYTVFIPVSVKEANVNIVRGGVNWHF
jgi:outer membrane immunogenic protein